MWKSQGFWANEKRAAAVGLRGDQEKSVSGRAGFSRQWLHWVEACPRLVKPEGAFPETPPWDLGGSWRQPRAAKGKEAGNQIKT